MWRKQRRARKKPHQPLREVKRRPKKEFCQTKLPTNCLAIESFCLRRSRNNCVICVTYIMTYEKFHSIYDQRHLFGVNGCDGGILFDVA